MKSLLIVVVMLVVSGGVVGQAIKAKPTVPLPPNITVDNAATAEPVEHWSCNCPVLQLLTAGDADYPRTVELEIGTSIQTPQANGIEIINNESQITVIFDGKSYKMSTAEFKYRVTGFVFKAGVPDGPGILLTSPYGVVVPVEPSPPSNLVMLDDDNAVFRAVINNRSAQSVIDPWNTMECWGCPMINGANWPKKGIYVGRLGDSRPEGCEQSAEDAQLGRVIRRNWHHIDCDDNSKKRVVGRAEWDRINAEIIKLNALAAKYAVVLDTEVEK